MKLIALSLAAFAFAASPALAQNQPSSDTTQNTMQPSSTTTTHHVHKTTRTTHIHGTAHAGTHHHAHHHAMHCGCPATHHHKGKAHHATSKKSDTDTSTQPKG